MSDDLRDRLAAALNSAPTKLIHDNPEALAFHRAGLGDEVLSSRHDRHHYCATCALCRGETATLAEAVLAELQPELDRFEEVRARHDGMILELRNYEARDKWLKAERDAALATLARVERAAALADVPDGGDERAAGFNAAMAVVRIALGGPTERPTRRHAGDFLRAPKTGETPTISCEFDASIEVPDLDGPAGAGSTQDGA